MIALKVRGEVDAGEKRAESFREKVVELLRLNDSLRKFARAYGSKEWILEGLGECDAARLREADSYFRRIGG